MKSFIPQKSVLIRCMTACLCLLLSCLAGCKETPAPPAKPAVVKKIIAHKKPDPPAAAPEAKQASVEKQTPVPPAPPKGIEKPALPSKQTAETKQAEAPKVKKKGPAPEALAAATDSLKSSLPGDIPHYDPKGKTDPFAPLFKDETPVQKAKGKKKPQRPLTPLEKIDLSQLKLVAILRAASGHKAMVEDSTGKGYILATGTYIGRNSGRVVKISKDRVIVEEETENFLGQLKRSKKELKLQKPFGEE